MKKVIGYAFEVVAFVEVDEEAPWDLAPRLGAEQLRLAGFEVVKTLFVQQPVGLATKPGDPNGLALTTSEAPKKPWVKPNSLAWTRKED